jgi:hypothetical protein
MHAATCLKDFYRFFLLTILSITSFFLSSAQSRENTLHELNELLINTVMDDVFTPPVASRIYVYPNIAFYECIRQDDPGAYQTLAGKLNGLKTIPTGQANIDHFIAASIAFSFAGQSLVGSEYRFEDWRKKFSDSIFANFDSQLVVNSIKYGKLVADSIIAWSKKDKYFETRGMMRHVVSTKTGTWQPTPSAYASALEPNWCKIRPLALTSCSQFSPNEKLKYSSSKQSLFYKNVMQVYTIGKTLDSTKKEIALYWDDNPNVSMRDGHMTYYVHKISPGGHWLMINKQACTQKNVSAIKTSLAYTLTAIAIFDGFINCWDEKFKTNLVRPVTVINADIDENWEPFIQTPPFPEFTSGHAVISNAAAEVLTGLFGDKFSFTDSTEILFGLKSRKFSSFYAAAEESSMSRVYGGIHYPTTAAISKKQGRQIGAQVLSIYNSQSTAIGK